MFANSAHLYDAVYSFKDYRAESEQLHALIEERSPGASTLLDVACGTGKHLEQLRAWYGVAGLDLNPQLLAVARERLGDVELHEGRHDRVRRSDAGSTSSPASSARSATSARSSGSTRRSPRWRLISSPGGVLIVEPWIIRTSGSPIGRTCSRSTSRT